MGTRGSVGFRVNKQDRVQYNHFDSYPSGLGNDVLKFIQSSTLEELKQVANSIELVREDVKPTAEQIKNCEAWTYLGVSSGSTDEWYCLLRNAQGDLNAYRNGLKYMIDGKSFLLDSLFCEYAYIINTDNNTLEFYSGFNKKVLLTKGRYASKRDMESRDNGYYGVALVGKFKLNDIIDASDEVIESIIEKMDKKAASFYKKQEKELTLSR
jgi:hypothetical protein